MTDGLWRMAVRLYDSLRCQDDADKDPQREIRQCSMGQFAENSQSL